MKRTQQNISIAPSPAVAKLSARPELVVLTPVVTQRDAWARELARRIATGWVIKMLGTMFGMILFFIAYFWVLEHARGPATIMPRSSLDVLIPFQPKFLPAYLSLWFYVSFAPALLLDRREMRSYAWATFSLSALGMMFFLLWPTAAPQPEVDWSHYPSFAFLRAADAAGNACPSLHVAFAVFTAIWFERLFRQMQVWRVFHLLNWAWCACILYSTIAIRQHVLLDVIAGAILGALVVFVQLRFLNTKALP